MLIELEIITNTESPFVAENKVGVQDTSGNFHGEFNNIGCAYNYMEAEKEGQALLGNEVRFL